MPDMTMRDTLRTAHEHLMMADKRVIVMGEDVRAGVFGVTSGLAARFGDDRVINTPISETAFLGAALGAAMTGLKPVVEIMFCDFMGVCFDQLLNQIAKIRYLSGGRVALPLVIRTTMGAGDGSGAMHSQSLHGLFAQIPGLFVACPATPADAAGFLKAAIRGPEPVIILEHKGLYDLKGQVEADLPALEPGLALCRRDGTDITLVSLSAGVHACLRAASLLAARGVAAEVIDARTVAPLDLDTICNSVRKTGRLLVVDEGAPAGGFADMVMAGVVTHVFACLRTAPEKLVPPATPVPYARALEQKWLISDDDIVAAACRQTGMATDI